MHEMHGVRSATVFGQSMHLLVDESVKRAQIDEQLRKVGVGHSEIHEMGPSLGNVFVELSASTLLNDKGRMMKHKLFRGSAQNSL